MKPFKLGTAEITGDRVTIQDPGPLEAGPLPMGPIVRAS
jgi:hypothetical protein